MDCFFKVTHKDSICKANILSSFYIRKTLGISYFSKGARRLGRFNSQVYYFSTVTAASQSSSLICKLERRDIDLKLLVGEQYSTNEMISTVDLDLPSGDKLKVTPEFIE
jgi:hypothetical protein